MKTPGSPKAVEFGCTCPVMDNAHGAGRGGDGKSHGWVRDENCPFHSVTVNSFGDDVILDNSGAVVALNVKGE